MILSDCKRKFLVPRCSQTLKQYTVLHRSGARVLRSSAVSWLQLLVFYRTRAVSWWEVLQCYVFSFRDTGMSHLSPFSVELEQTLLSPSGRTSPLSELYGPRRCPTLYVWSVVFKSWFRLDICTAGQDTLEGETVVSLFGYSLWDCCICTPYQNDSYRGKSIKWL